jgi:SAM-dependent methyltransferase
MFPIGSIIRSRLLPGAAGALLFRLANPGKPRFDCPLCGYRGPFMDSIAAWGSRAHAMCPRCGANERARLQYLVVKELAASRPLRTLRMVHFSPERQLQPYFRQAFGTYRTAGIWDEPVDFPADLTKLPFEDGSWDVLFASHVLEHVQDDERALAEIRRVLRPGGLAILPVPIAGERTVEYGEPNPREAGHVRAPGRDYFDRYRRHFARVEVWDSARFDGRYQLFNVMPGGAGGRYADFVPVCYA